MKKMIAFTLASMTLGTALIGTAMGVQANEIGTNKSALNVVTDNFSSSPVAMLYTGANATGRTHIAFESESSLLDNIPWLNDSVRSIRLSPRSKIVIYQNVQFAGRLRTFVNPSDTEELLINLPSDWTNIVSAFKLSPYEENEFGVKLFEHSNQGGRIIILDEPHSDYDLAESGDLDNRISSIEIYPNSGIIVFEEAGLLGTVFAVYENHGTEVMHIDLAVENPELNDTISSYSAYSLN
ncbi:hypothetical protein D920_02904 [Enterococcus faecalis 13-SD-W-01]|nr:hypothetical protein D920_02904 [Enterococcus faecalis 13-SD-W-01]